jgi:hypothetical protein
MTRIKTLGLCLVAAFALSAVVASMAQANPEYYSKGAIGSTVGPVPFTATTGIAFLEGHTSKAKIECKKGSGSGEVDTATTSVKNLTNFQECEVAGLALPCQNHGTKEIETKDLQGELGPVSATKPGTRLSPESGEFLAEFECGGGAIVIKVKGSLIGELSGASGKTPAEGKFGASGTLTFAETGGIQKITKFLGELTGHQLESVVKEGANEHTELSGQSVKATIKSVPASNLGETL